MAHKAVPDLAGGLQLLGQGSSLCSMPPSGLGVQGAAWGRRELSLHPGGTQ